ncbi:MAG: hypothetical protein D6763_08205, partial [Alphaproteobacteria bacterium]
MVRLTILSALFLLPLLAFSAGADVLIRLKDGRTIRVPVAISDVAGIEFEDRSARTTSEAATKPEPPPVTRQDNRVGARLVEVGPGKLYATPSAAAKAAE